MIRGGNATIFVSDFDAAVRFYTEVLGLTLRMNAAPYWAEVVAGNELVIGIHPTNENHAAPGTVGAVEIGLTIDGTLEQMIEQLTPKGVDFRGRIVSDANGTLRFQYLRDPDGNVLYLMEMCQAEAHA
jgi:catechol 2,3-dioxygenase-like lactoylglutathione lyase family enzyme